jgi:hypothetical protein
MTSHLSFDHTPELQASRHSGATEIALSESVAPAREPAEGPDALWFPGYSERPLFSHPFARR